MAVAEGDHVVVFEYAHRGYNTVNAVVVKVARVFVTLKAVDGYGREWKMRLSEDRESGRVDSQYSTSPFFKTIKQHEHDQAVSEAREILRDHGIQFGGRYDTPKWTDDQLFKLSDAVERIRSEQ